MSTEPKPTAELSATNSHGDGLRVRFNWNGDRYGHVIESRNDGRVRPLLISLEGGEGHNGPFSPPFQQINVSWISSDTEHRHVAMLVGAAGKCHWSMCVAVRDHSSRPRDHQVVDTELIFDVACRLDEPLNLLSSYRAVAQPVAISEDGNQAYVPAHPPGCLVIAESVQLELDTVTDALPILRCRALAANEESPATVRWRYALRSIGVGRSPIRLMFES